MGDVEKPAINALHDDHNAYIGAQNIFPKIFEYIMTQEDHKLRYQKCDLHLSTPPLEFNCLTRNTKHDTRNILQI